MPPGAQPATMVCRCGKTLKLPGAVPGRVGRCPSCGATFRVPGAAPAPAAPNRPPADPASERPTNLDRPPSGRPGPRPEAGGYAIDPDHDPAFHPARAGVEPPSNPGRLGDPTTRRQALDPVGRGGIFPLPRRPESSPFGSLLYPFWDGAGLAWLVLLPPALAATSLAVFALIPIVLKGGVLALFGPIAFAMIVVFGFVLGYALAILGAVLTASAQGDVHHPRWPDIELGTIVVAVVRFAAAGGLGVGLMAFPALSYWRSQATPGPLERLVFAEILAAGGLYSLMALVSVWLHEDVLGVKPTMVLGAAFRVGLAYLAPLAAFAATMGLGALIVAGLYRLKAFGPLFLATWAAWVFALYAGLVVMRLLGRAYHRRARRVGWFPESRRRKEEPLGPPPAPIPEL